MILGSMAVSFKGSTVSARGVLTSLPNKHTAENGRVGGRHTPPRECHDHRPPRRHQGSLAVLIRLAGGRGSVICAAAIQY